MRCVARCSERKTQIGKGRASSFKAPRSWSAGCWRQKRQAKGAGSRVRENRFVPLDQNLSIGYAFSFRGTVAAAEDCYRTTKWHDPAPLRNSPDLPHFGSWLTSNQ